MSTDLAISHSVKDLEIMASKVAKSRLFNMDESQAFTLMLLCQSRGIHPIEAVMRFDIIQGRPAMKADAMLAEFQRLGGTVHWLSDNDNADYQEATFSHPKLCAKPLRAKFSIKDATRAGVAKKDNWVKYPSSMLRARVVSNALRMVAPGIVSGIYTPEEVGDMDPRPIEAAVVEPPPPVKTEAEVSDWAKRKVEEQTRKYAPRPAPSEPIAEGEEAFQAYLFSATQRANDYWSLLHSTGGRPAPEPITNMFAVENWLGSWAEQQGRVKPDYLHGPTGVRSRAKLKKFLARWYTKYRDEFERLAEEHISEKLEAAMKAAGLSEEEDLGDLPEELVSRVDGHESQH